MAVRKKVEALLKLPGNNECADCTAPKPNWASASCGVFVCFNCSGLHRGLGTHLSFVRSVNLDEWTEKQYKKMKEWGNLNANAYFEARLDKKKPDQHASVNEMNRYIRDKYEMGKWVPDGGEGDPRRGGKPSRSPRAAAPEPTPEPRKAAKLRVKVSSRKAQPKPAAPAPDLLSFDAPEPTAPEPAFAAFGQAPPQQQAPFDAFGTQATRAAPSSSFDAFASAPAAPPPQPAPPPASNDAILSMFNAPPSVPRGGPMPGGFPMQPAPSMAPRGPPMGYGQPPRPMQPMMQPQQGFAAFGQARPPQPQQGMMMARQMPQQMGFPPQQQQQMGMGMGYAPRPPMPPQQNFGGMGMMGGGSMPSPMMSPRGMGMMSPRGMTAPPRPPSMPPKQDSMPGGFGPNGFTF